MAMITFSRRAGLASNLALLCCGPAMAQAIAEPAETAQGDLSVTIYNQQALIQDIRTIAIAAGRSRIEFPDVSAQIRPQTLSFAAEGAGIVEQNFDYDLLTPGKLMEKAVGQTLTLIGRGFTTSTLVQFEGVDEAGLAGTITRGGSVTDNGTRLQVNEVRDNTGLNLMLSSNVGQDIGIIDTTQNGTVRLSSNNSILGSADDSQRITALASSA